VRYYPKVNFVIELFAEIRQRVRNATWRSIWAWLTYGSGIRLLMLTIIVPLILLGEYFGWFR
jgi:hypothetical protein